MTNKRPSREELESLYHGESLNTLYIGKRYGVGKTTVLKWMDFYDIKRRNKSDRQLPKEVKRLPREELVRLYHEERLSMRIIAKLYHISSSTVRSWLKEEGIETRNKSESRLSHGVTRPSKEELTILYNRQMLSTAEIAKIYGVSNKAIAKWMEQEGIKRRHKPRVVERPLKDELESLYVNQRMSTTTIGQELGVTSTTVGEWLHQYSIPIRNQSAAHLAHDVVVPTKEDLHKMYVIKGMSARKIAKVVGVTDHTIRNWLVIFDIPIGRGFNQERELESLLDTYVGGSENE